MITDDGKFESELKSRSEIARVRFVNMRVVIAFTQVNLKVG